MNLISKKTGKYSTLFFAIFLLNTSLVLAKDEVNAGMIQIGVPVKFPSIIAPSNSVDTTFTYKSNIPSVASVDSLTGEITGKHPGSAIITATSANKKFKITYAATVYGKILILPSVLSNNMVIQQKTQAALWGWAAPNSKVEINASWGKTANAVADASGAWSTKIKTPKAIAGENQIKHTLTFKGQNNTITLSNILIGDVYLCSGQSNMEFKMASVLNAKVEIAAANYPNIRINNPYVRKEFVPVENNGCSWKECSPANIEKFSAVAYFFALQLYTNPKINIPIGLIVPSRGSSCVQSWISRKALTADPELKSKVQDIYDLKPTLDHIFGSNVLYNGMISSLAPFSLRGFLWYQGESNSKVENNRDLYSKLLTVLITSWRVEWGQGDLPFYFVQMPAHERLAPELRDQLSYTLTVPNTGMAVTLDLADVNLDNIHPINKKDVGIRLAKIAEANIYKQNVVFAGPMLQSFKIEGDKIRIKYQKLSIGTGLISRDGKVLNHFQIAGSDNVYVEATAVIDGNDVIVSAPSVSCPKNVAFAYTNTSIPNLINKEGLMACPFRSDRWNYNVKLKK